MKILIFEVYAYIRREYPSVLYARNSDSEKNIFIYDNVALRFLIFN